MKHLTGKNMSVSICSCQTWVESAAKWEVTLPKGKLATHFFMSKL